MGRRPNGNRRICFCLSCRGEKPPVHRNTIWNHTKQKGYMTPADIASLLEQQATEGSGSEDEEDSLLDAQLREEESERLVAANQALFKDLGSDDLRSFMQDENMQHENNNNDGDGDSNVPGGSGDDEDDEDLEWRSTQTDEAELLKDTVNKWVSGKLYFLRNPRAS